MYGYEIAPPPPLLDGCRVLLRMIDGLAFRFYWATEGLRPEDQGFRPADDCMSTHELVEHILHLACMIKQTVFDADSREHHESPDFQELRDCVLEQLRLVREHLERLQDRELGGHRVLKRDKRSFPVWNIMNGPLADALTHVGQLNSWRRMSGNPTDRINVFEGTPPSESA